MSFVLILSLIAIGWGIFALRHNTKHLPKSLKYAPVFLTALGTIICWQHLSTMFPVYDKVQTHLIEVHPYEIVVDVTGEKVRDCKREDFSAHIVDTMGKSHEVDMIHTGDPLFSKQLPLGPFDTKAIIVIAQPVQDYSRLYFTSIHTCALGVEVKTTFGELILPPEFNAKNPTPLIETLGASQSSK